MAKTKKKQAGRQNAVIVGLFAVVGLIAVGYAALATTLTINGTAKVVGDWNVKITDISVAGDGEDETAPSYTDTTATFSANLVKPGDARSYTVTIKNEGNIDAKLSSVNLTPGAAGCADIEYTLDEAPAVDSTLAVGDSTTAKITATFKSDASEVSSECMKTVTGVFNYVQAD